LIDVLQQVDVVETLIDYLQNDVTSAERHACLNLEDTSSGCTLLHLSVRHGWSPLVAVKLIKLGIDVDRRDRDWKTAFSTAVEFNRRDIIPLLVKENVTIIHDKRVILPRTWITFRRCKITNVWLAQLAKVCVYEVRCSIPRSRQAGLWLQTIL